MIRSIYQKNVPWTSIRILWACITFFVVNFFIFFAFMNICFQNLVQNPSEPITATLLCILLVDLLWFIIQTRKICVFNNLLDFIILITLTVSFTISSINNNSWAIYLQVLVLIKIKDVFYFKRIVYELMKHDRITFRLFTILKIIYFIVLIGHITGCIFYLIDNTLIEKQYFGSLAENPDLYYQGNLHVFSPIYGLSQVHRYVYAIYFTFSLLSTVAFGDIIPKNYFQNVYVSVLLIGATIGISIIIQQMYLVFRNQKTKKYQLMIKYVSEYIRSQKHISRQFRYELINYMIDSQWKELTQAPNLKLLTKQMIQKMLLNSLLCQDDLPLLIKKYFLKSMSSKYYPSNYKLIDNNDINNHVFGTIIIEASVKIGYTNSLIGLKQFRKNVFGFQQLLLGTNYHHRSLNVLLASQAQVFILDQLKFRQILSKIKSQSNDTCQTPIQLYQIAKDEAIVKSRREPCIYCDALDHTLINCKQCHYVQQATYSEIYQKHFNQKRQYQIRRSSLKSLKYTSINRPVKQNQMGLKRDKFLDIQITNRNNLKLKKICYNYLQKLVEYDEKSSLKHIQTYSEWKYYFSQFNL